MMKRQIVRSAVLVVAFIALAVASALASEFSDDLKSRRARVMDALGPDAMLIVWSAAPQRYSLDIDYPYRQDSNLYYLTGITQDDTVLVLMPGNETHREMLFIKDKNPAREHWTGPSLSAEQATARSGIDTVLTVGQFDAFVAAMLGRSGFGPISDKEAARFFAALAAGRARVSLPLEPRHGLNDPLTPPFDFAHRIKDRFVGFDVTDALPILQNLRVVKTAYERKVLVKSLEISSDAQMAGMRAAHPGAFEYEVKAAIEAVHRGRGAVSWSYPSIVGSGTNATILHYPDSDRQMRAGELLLVDAACNYGYMSGDITRTYPVGGSFSPAQKTMYQIVLQAQDEAAAAAKAGATLENVHKKTVDVIKAGLLRLGLITETTGE